LARRGIATLRMDDRGTGASKGVHKGATSADFGEDIRAGLAYLRTRPEIDTMHLGLLGHSEGAIIAPIVALKEPSLRALVLLAGVARPAREVLNFQMKNNIEHNARFSQTQKDSAITAIPQAVERKLAADPWMAYFLVHDPAADARQLRTPAVLMLTGANDQQADAKQLPDWMSAFVAAGNTDVTAQILPGLNHLFVVDPDGFPGNYTKLPPPVRVDPNVVGFVTDWLVRRLK
jgi:dienelactone hydrolase